VVLLERMMQTMTAMLRKPRAVLPIVLSLAALALIVVYVALFGVVRSQDEGAPARLFQLLMVGQALAVAFFAVRWIPQAPRPAIGVVALQMLAAAVPIVTIVLLEI
jgi:peptidoglycan/LPS O-acetylase OafA/YrhL